MNKRIPIRTPAGNVWLEVKAIVARRELPAHLFATLEKAEVTLTKHTGELLELLVTVRIPGKILDEKEAIYPADWWQAFRARWFKTPIFLRLTGGPVRWERVTLRAEAAFPSIQVPNHKPFVQVTLKKESTQP